MGTHHVIVRLNPDGTIAQLVVEPGTAVFVWSPDGSRCRVFRSPEAFSTTFQPGKGRAFTELLDPPSDAVFPKEQPE